MYICDIIIKLMLKSGMYVNNTERVNNKYIGE